MKTAPEALSASGAVLGLSGYMSSELVLVIALVLSLVVLLVLAVLVVFVLSAVVGLVLAAAAVGGRIVVVIVVVLHIKLTSLSTPLVSPVLFLFMQKIGIDGKKFLKKGYHIFRLCDIISNIQKIEGGNLA